ncbi:TD and POZ domain-containing protein 4 [Nephila pilipes]|uniref:TD and POZ domain-containing protein 4 n=1 Tax=Nephila pilipes TaxID=299642 RepID=A0A8X6UPB8_NEPPI|nr:TD and POZ domain-containing protein 4 [Nephila pilipes]
MAFVSNSENAFFTYIWVIENFSKRFLDDIKSPSFIVDSMEETTWHLILYRYIGWIGIRIVRQAKHGGPEIIQSNYELSVLNSNGYPSIRKENKNCFKKGDYFDCSFFIDLYKPAEVWKALSPNETLTVRCQMWRGEKKISPNADLCFARSVLGLERSTFTWSIRKFKSLQPGQKRSIILQSSFKGGPAPVLSISFRNICEQDTMSIDIFSGTGLKRYVFECEISLLDIEGKVVNTFKRSSDFDSGSIQKHITKYNRMIDCHSLNDILTLRCTYQIHFGIVLSRIEDYRRFSYLAVEDVVPAMDTGFFEKTAPCCPLMKDFTELYQGIQCDVNLRVGTESFPAHKNVLSIRSSVFKAMFRSDVRERMSNDVTVYGVDADTLQRLLHYIYTDKVEEPLLDSAMKLYIAAVHYKLSDLRNKCATLLKAKLCKYNIIDILDLADRYDDEYLKMAVEYFISAHPTEFFSFDEWENIKKSLLRNVLRMLFPFFFLGKSLDGIRISNCHLQCQRRPVEGSCKMSLPPPSSSLIDRV